MWCCCSPTLPPAASGGVYLPSHRPGTRSFQGTTQAPTQRYQRCKLKSSERAPDASRRTGL
eukprot:scaffold255866_cov45-Tisochrysis_lutea.AAC.1